MDKNGLVYVCLFALGLNAIRSAVAVIRALDPAVPRMLNRANAWSSLIEDKTKRCSEARFGVSSALTSLVTAWMLVYSGFHAGAIEAWLKINDRFQGPGANIFLGLVLVAFITFYFGDADRERSSVTLILHRLRQLLPKARPHNPPDSTSNRLSD